MTSSSSVTAISRTPMDLNGAEIIQGGDSLDLDGEEDERYPTILLPNQSSNGVSSLLALDIGGTLIKLVYFSRHEDQHTNGGGRLHFKKFEIAKIEECLDFIESKQLHCGGVISQGRSAEAQVNENVIIKATGGGAYKFADMFKERLGVSIENEDEIACSVAGANFLLKAIHHEAFTHMTGQKKFVQIDKNELFPYLLVNIGSGVSMIKVDDGKHERVTGSILGGGTYLGLASLLTGCKSFDELLALSQRGDDKELDLLVGDIYGGMDYAKIGLSASTIASSFGKVVSENKKLEDCRPEDMSLSLLRMISFHFSQIAYYEAKISGLKRIFFGGFFVSDHAYTMDFISFAVDYWSKGDVKAMFLRHEGFLGALGAFMSYENHGLSVGAPLGDLSDKLTWHDMMLSVEIEGEDHSTVPSIEAEVLKEKTYDWTPHFSKGLVFETRSKLEEWIKKFCVENHMLLIVKKSDLGSKRRHRIIYACDREGKYRPPKERKDLTHAQLAEQKKKKKDTGTKKCQCPFAVKFVKVHGSEDRWEFAEVNCGHHNHDLSPYIEGHAYHARLNVEEKKVFRTLHETGLKPKQTLMAIKTQFPENTASLQTVYNERKKYAKVKVDGRSEFQQLEMEAEKAGYVIQDVRDDTVV